MKKKKDAWNVKLPFRTTADPSPVGDAESNDGGALRGRARWG